MHGGTRCEPRERGGEARVVLLLERVVEHELGAALVDVARHPEPLGRHTVEPLDDRLHEAARAPVERHHDTDAAALELGELAERKRDPTRDVGRRHGAAAYSGAGPGSASLWLHRR